MPFNEDGTAAEPTDPPSLPPDLGPPGSLYPDRPTIAKYPEVMALGVCEWVNPLTGQPCGYVHTRCTGHAKKWANAPCSKARKLGQLVCDAHGGRAPQALKAAAKRIAARQALDEVGALLEQAHLVVEGQTLGEQLVGAIHRAGAMAQAYQWLLDQMPIEAEWSYREVGGGEGGAPQRWVNVEVSGLLMPDAKGQQTLHAYEEGARHWTKLHSLLLVEAAKLGLDERRQMFAEQQVAVIGDAVVELVAGLGLELGDPAVVPVVEAFLRRVAGEPVKPVPALDGPVIDVGGDTDDSLFGAP